MYGVAHLCPSDVRRDDKFDVSVAENAQDGAPKVAVDEAAPPLEELGGGFLLTRLVLAPREVAVATRLLLLNVALHVSGTLVWSDAGKYEDGLDAQFFERPEVALDACGHSERKSTGGC